MAAGPWHPENRLSCFGKETNPYLIAWEKLRASTGRSMEARDLLNVRALHPVLEQPGHQPVCHDPGPLPLKLPTHLPMGHKDPSFL